MAPSEAKFSVAPPSAMAELPLSTSAAKLWLPPSTSVPPASSSAEAASSRCAPASSSVAPLATTILPSGPLMPLSTTRPLSTCTTAKFDSADA